VEVLATAEALAKAEAKNQKDRYQPISTHRYSFDGNASVDLQP
jgi:hypothetical protein